MYSMRKFYTYLVKDQEKNAHLYHFITTVQHSIGGHHQSN